MNNTQFMAIVPYFVKAALYAELNYKNQICTEEQLSNMIAGSTAELLSSIDPTDSDVSPFNAQRSMQVEG